MTKEFQLYPAANRERLELLRAGIRCSDEALAGIRATGGLSREPENGAKLRGKPVICCRKIN